MTLIENVERVEPSIVDGEVILESGSSIVWFSYPGLWHDIGLFHRRDGAFTGYYANILTPVLMDGTRWDTTDLFLDVWLGVQGEPTILDEVELVEALEAGWIDQDTAGRAREEAAALVAAARTGSWPPHEVRVWTLERAREAGQTEPPP